jgi:hypothetical protein
MKMEKDLVARLKCLIWKVSAQLICHASFLIGEQRVMEGFLALLKNWEAVVTRYSP